MIKYWKRLALALLISSSCFIGTVIWYRSGLETKEMRSTKGPIARISETTNEVQRKPLARVIWENITLNEDLYSGEAIRTSTASEAKILFLKTGTLIELEPESLIVLEENEDGLALNFLQGNLFVRSGENSSVGDGFKLKSGENEIALNNNADLSLSKTSQGNLGVDVMGGSAQFKLGDRQVTLEKNQSGTLDAEGLEIDKNKIQITSPLPGEPVYADSDSTIPFRWQKLPNGYTVHLELGEERSKLIPLPLTASGEEGLLSTPIKVGKSFWRLVAKHTDPNQPELRSSIFPLDVHTMAPPLILEPEKQAQIAVDQLNPKTKLRWVSRSPYETLVVEVAKDPQLKNKVVQQTLDAKLSFADLDIKESGEYYLRLTGFMRIKNKSVPVSSPIQKFHMQVGIQVVPPKLKSPMPEQNFSFRQVNESGVLLSWDPVLGITKYKIQLQKQLQNKSEFQPLAEKIVSSNPYRLSNLAPGAYKWSIQSVGPDGELSSISEVRTFTVNSMPEIEWVDGTAPSEFLYYTPSPSFVAQWKNQLEDVAKWRVRFAPAESFTPDLAWQEVTEPILKTHVDATGIYHVEVEALNVDGKPVARSAVKTITVKEKPLLPAPEFASDLPETLKANRKGQLSFQWSPVKGAAKYKVELIDSKTQSVVGEKFIERNVASMDRLNPGQYKIKVRAIDTHNRDGQPSSDKLLEVPKVSDIQAPKIKSFKVE